jgi:signal transduction histidine kinase
MVPSKYTKWAVYIAVCAFVGLLLTLELYFNWRVDMMSAGRAPVIDFVNLAIPQFGRAVMWALLGPLIRQLWLKMPLHHGRWFGGVGFHLGMSFVVMATYYLGRMGTYRLLWGDPSGRGFWTMALQGFYGRNLIDMVYYWAVIGVSYGLQIREKYSREALKAAQFETRLMEAELKALKQQLNPHFLFNTMNTIAVLVREQRNSEAVTLIARISSLLRMSLENSGVQTVPLRHEVDFLTRYLQVQQARFGDRLQFKSELEPATLDAIIPNLILQPIVENAILHGVAQLARPGCVEISARLRNQRLELQVRDDGPGFGDDRDGPFKEGIGLTNTRVRLTHHYGSDYQMVLKSEKGRGVTATLMLPYQTQLNPSWHAA